MRDWFLEKPQIGSSRRFLAFRRTGSDAEDVMVMAYRFKLEIERRPIVCAKRNDYFFMAMDEPAVGQAQFLAWLDSSKIALVRVLRGR
jgi:hypothetical protein